MTWLHRYVLFNLLQQSPATQVLARAASVPCVRLWPHGSVAVPNTEGQQLPHSVQATFWAYFLCLGLLATQTSRALPTLLRAFSATATTQRSTALQLVAAVALTVTVAQGFLYRPIHLAVAVCLGLGAMFAFFRTPSALLSVAAAGLLVCTAAFALLPLRKEPNTALVILPGVVAACAVVIVQVYALFRRVSVWASGVGSEAATRTGSGQRGGWWALSVQSVLAIVTSVCIVALQRTARGKPDCLDGGPWQRRMCAGTAGLNLVLTNTLEPMTSWVHEVAWLRMGGMSAPQVLLWCCFCSAPAVPLFTARNTLPRLLSSLFGFQIMFMILAISWESVFFACFSCTLIAYSLLLTSSDSGARGAVPQQPGLVEEPACPEDWGTMAAVNGAALDEGALSPRTPRPRRAAARRSSTRQAAQAAQEDGSAEDIHWRRGRSASARRGSSSSMPAKSPRRRNKTPVRRVGGRSSGGKAPDTPPARSETLIAQEDAVQPDAGLSMADVWYAFALVFSTNLGFFGMGNMASVASFEPASVLRLMTCAFAS